MILSHSHRAKSIGGEPLSLDLITKGMEIIYQHGAGETSRLTCSHVDKKCAKFSGFRSSVLMTLSEPLNHSEYELLKEALIAFREPSPQLPYEYVTILNKGFRLGYVDYVDSNTPILTPTLQPFNH